MSLNVGSRFAHYHVTALIGEGGMGQVYRATDTRLHRDVALKTLPAPSAGSAERLARFQREAQVLASLNHPNIATIHGIEEADGVTALVMELVEGPTLADSIARARLPLDDALAIARQLTDALEAAHDQGIVHRDLKPANVKVRPDGTVKVLDFGLAKLIQEAGDGQAATRSQSPTITSPAMTRAGIILGTAAYMSPEQARGKAVDARADIWAFGCVLYEMLTGARAFPGEDVTETLAAVVKTEPDWGLLQTSVPARVRLALRACLQKDPRQRAKDIHDVRLALDGAFEEAPSEAPVPVKKSGLRLASLYVALVLLTAVLGLGLVLWGRDPAAGQREVTKFTHDLPLNQPPRNVGRPILTMSRSGDYFLYNTVQGLVLRRLDELQARVIPGTSQDLTNPFLSPDGQWIGYWDRASDQIKRIPINGGPPVVIGPAVNPLGVSWESDTMILVGQPEGIVRMTAAGGTPELVVSAVEGELLSNPRLLPGGDLVLCSATRFQAAPRWDTADIVVQSISSGERTVVLRGGADAHYLSSGHLVYALESTLFLVRFDLKRLTVLGGSVPVIEGVLRSNVMGSANYEVSDDGTLAYLSGGDAGLRELVWVDRRGGEEPIGAPRRSYVYAQLSPDGTRVALDVRDDESDIWIWDLQRQSLQRLTSDPNANRGVVWSPDGRRVAFSREADNKEEVVWQHADGSGSPEPLTDGSPTRVMPSAFSPDGATLFYHSTGPPFDIWMIAVGGPPTGGVALFQGPALEVGATLSLDGRWLAYESSESGRPEVYVRPFPDLHAARWQVSTEGGRRPLWSRDGRELFYMGRTGLDTAILSVTIDTRSGFAVSAPTTLFENRYAAPNAGRQAYDVSPDGQRFLMIKPVVDEDARQGRVVVIRNWLEELKRQMPTD